MCRLLVALALLVALLATSAPARAQRADGLDQPLVAANLCGPGDGSETHFTIAATGDTFPHDNIQAVGEAQGYDMLFDYVRPFLQAADLAYTNFDGAMLEGAGYTGYPNFNFNPALAAALKGAGVGLVSTANNHILDRGPEGLDATLAVLAANGIEQHGAAPSAGPSRPPYLPLTLSRDGESISIGFISATWGTNGIADPFGQVNLLYQSSDYGSQGEVRQEILDAVARAAAETDIVVVAAHWGYEYEFYPRDTQIEAARRLAEAGADVILGAQSHTLQPVDIIDVGGRRVLVIYSLANFLASQAAYQSQFYSATSVIFYVGLARSADGQVRVTGYRYLPTIHVDNDTRPAPIQPGSADDVIGHVRTIMRDPGGLRQIPADPPAGRVEVCPPILLGEAPDRPIPGDFAQHYLTLGGGVAPRPLTDGIAVFGLPLGPVADEFAGDCATPAKVLYTERQRLELAAPGQVVGTQLGVHAFSKRYPGAPIERRTDLAAPDAFADPRFRSFYEQYGGLAVFGYPISGAQSEDDAISGAPTTVQYFERARFELAPNAAPGAPLTEQVRLGLLGSELGGLAGLCGAEAAAAVGESATVSGAVEGETAPLPAVDAGIAASLAQLFDGAGWIAAILVFGLTLAILALAFFAISDWRSYRRRGPQRGYRRRRSAHERFASARAAAREQAMGDRPQAIGSWGSEGDPEPAGGGWEYGDPAAGRGYGWAAPESAGYPDEPAGAHVAWLEPEEYEPAAGATFTPAEEPFYPPQERIYSDEEPAIGATFTPADEPSYPPQEQVYGDEEPAPRRARRTSPRPSDKDDDELLRELLGG